MFIISNLVLHGSEPQNNIALMIQEFDAFELLNFIVDIDFNIWTCDSENVKKHGKSIVHPLVFISSLNHAN